MAPCGVRSLLNVVSAMALAALMPLAAANTDVTEGASGGRGLAVTDADRGDFDVPQVRLVLDAAEGDFNAQTTIDPPASINEPPLPAAVFLTLDDSVTFTGQLNGVALQWRLADGTERDRIEGPFAGRVVAVGSFERDGRAFGGIDAMQLVYNGPPDYVPGTPPPTFGDNNSFSNDDWLWFNDPVNNIVSNDTVGALIAGGWVPQGSGGGALRKRGDDGEPDGCYSEPGSYVQTCADGTWVRKPGALDEACWLCTFCPADNLAAPTCVQAPSTCGDITNIDGTIICNTGPEDSPPPPSPSPPPEPSGCTEENANYITPAFPTRATPDDSPSGLGARTQNWVKSQAGRSPECNVMVIQRETYSGEPDSIDGYYRKESSNFQSTNTFDIYLFNAATFTNEGDGGFNNWAWLGNQVSREDTDDGDTVSFEPRTG